MSIYKMFRRVRVQRQYFVLIIGVGAMTVLLMVSRMSSTNSKKELDQPPFFTQQRQSLQDQGKHVQTYFINETNFKPYCAMYSSAYKHLVWPDIPSNFTDWTYTNIRKCPKLIIPNNLTNTTRVKYSLKCDLSNPKLVPSFTNRSDDIQVVTMNDSCLAAFINSCCIAKRGVPNVVHYVWYFKRNMKFDLFLSMLSVIRYVRPCIILFHGEYLPYGKYWDYIIRIYPNVLQVKRPRPLSIFGKKIKHHEHSGDIMRIEALIEMGGIYFDADFILVRDIKPLQQYEITMCRQHTGFLLTSFIMAKKNATFLTLWMEGYRKDYRNGSYVFNAMVYNDKLAYKRRDLIHVENGTLCVPAKLMGKAMKHGNVYDWSAIYGYHLYSRIIHFPWDVDWIKNYNTTLGSMVRQVVYGNKELCV